MGPKQLWSVVAVVLFIGLAAGSGGVTLGATTASPTQAHSPTAVETANGTLDVHFINVGQSASTLLVAPGGETILIDSGDWRDDGKHVLDYLQQRGIDRLDHLVTTHADADHIGGNAAVIDYYETEADGVGAVYDPGIASSSQTYERYLDAVEEHNVTLYETREGDTVPVDNLTVEVLGPPEPYLASEARNENSIVLKVTHGETSFLFTGDAEVTQEEYLVDEYGPALNVTVLKAGHHGSSSSSGEPLLNTTTPARVVISSGYDSQYGHPNNETLDRLAAQSIPAYWTATHGHVVVTSDGRTVTIKTQANATTDPECLRSAEPVSPGTNGNVELRERFSAGGGTESRTPTTTETRTAAATATVTSTATSSSTTGSLQLVEIHADAQGTERENLNDEYLVFENTGTETLDLSEWQLSDEADHRYTFPDGFTLAAGDHVTVRSGSGSDSETDLYWGSSRPIWNNGGDTVTVTDENGTVVLEETYA